MTRAPTGCACARAVCAAQAPAIETLPPPPAIKAKEENLKVQEQEEKWALLGELRSHKEKREELERKAAELQAAAPPPPHILGRGPWARAWAWARA
eukprot:1549100-Prymnesium_polylepis.1